MNYVITGGTSEIGSALLRRLVPDKGARVIATGFRHLVANPRDDWAALDSTDLCDEQALQELHDTVARTFTSPFIVVHSVGLFGNTRPFTTFLLRLPRT